MSFEGQFDPDDVNENIVDDYLIPLLAMPDRDSVELETEVREEESDSDGDGQDHDIEDISFFSD